MSQRQSRKIPAGRRRRQAPSEEKMNLSTRESRAMQVMRPSSKMLGGFPTKQRVKLKYVDFINLDPGAGATVSAVYGLNNLFDPYSGAGGHQPSNFDRWTTIYRKFTVVSTDILLVENSVDIVNVIPGIFGFIVDTSGNQVGGATAAENLCEQPYAQYGVTGLRAGGTSSGALTARINIHEWFGLPNESELVADSDYMSSASAGPPTQLYVETYLASILGDNPGAVTLRLELVFDVIMYDPHITVAS